ncbi:MAG: nitrous oxide-stimulated promoter family protein [Betaproteobacteria bacterium]
MGGRRLRELATIRAMILLYCGEHHGRKSELCAECAPLHGYATRRLERCVFGDAKPTCANCTVHCYSAAMREQIRVVMRYAGPRMLFRHPVLGIAHLNDGRRPAPELPVKAREKAPVA